MAWQYAQERFPPALVLMLSASFAAACLGLFSDLPLAGGAWWRTFGLLTLLYLALLFRYRVIDEWKDFRHDTINYPNRPIPRGAITAKTLIVMASVAVVLELGSVVALGGLVGLARYQAVAVFSVLTAFDFFAKGWLERHFTTAFVVHQLVYVPMFGWAALTLGATLGQTVALGVASATALFASAEVIRKFQPRENTEGEYVPDTYSVVWGRGWALAVTVVLIVISGTLAHAVAAGTASLFVSGIAAVVLLVKHDSDSWVMGGAGAHVPILAIAMLS